MIKNIAIILTVISVIFVPVHSWSAEHIVAYEDVFDFGSVSFGSEVSHSFIIPNKKNDTLFIRDAYASCECIHILSYHQEIPPHENGQLEVRLIPSEQGEAAYDIVVEIADSPITPLHYKIKGVIVGEISPNEKKKKDQLEIPARLLTRKLRMRNRGFVTSVETVLDKLQGREEIILIDIRSSKEFERLRIPGSINIPLFAIKTKTSFKDKSLVLINEGHSYSELEKACKGLRDAGFNALILDGGLHQWKEKGALLEGDIFAEKNFNKIPPQDFFSEKDYENWIVINASQSEVWEAQYLIPQGIRLMPLDHTEEFISELRTIMDRYKATPFLSVLIFDNNGESYEEIEKCVKKEGLKNIFYLQGGLEGYKEFLNQQASILRGKNKEKRNTNILRKCATCP